MSLIPVVEQVVNDKVQAAEMFTAHDVTIEVRGRGHKAGHAEIRSAVHDYYNRGGMGVAYTRSTITVPGGTPFLYHRLVDDPSTFVNIRNANVPTSSTIAVPPMLGNIVANSDDDDDDDNSAPVANGTIQSVPNITVATKASNKPGQVDARQVDDRGTLSIPTKLVRDAGFRSNQKVYAWSFLGTNQLIVNSSPPQTMQYHEYTVDTNDQIRVTQKCLQDAGIPGSQYNLSLKQLFDSTCQIVIEAA